MSEKLREFWSNLRSYVSHFGQGALLIIGVIIIIVLVGATFYYGSERRDQAEQTPSTTTEQTAPEPSAQPQPDDDSDIPAVTSAPDEGTEAGLAVQDTEDLQEIANTGPEAWYIAGLVLLLVAGLGYGYSRQSVITAHISK